VKKGRSASKNKLVDVIKWMSSVASITATATEGIVSANAANATVP